MTQAADSPGARSSLAYWARVSRPPQAPPLAREFVPAHDSGSAMNPAEAGEPGRPRKRRLSYALVLTPLLIGNALMLTLCLLGLYVLSATRAYVGGESHWSKGRAQAVKHLRAFAISGEPAQLQRFQEALEPALGDREARLELDRPSPDLNRVRAAFLRGGNDAEDIPAMIRLYRCCGRNELMQASVQAWQSADALIAELQTIAGQLNALHAQDDARPAAERAQLLLAIDRLESELLGLERQFSQALGEASRATYRTLALAIGLTALLLTLTAYVLARAGLRRQARYELALEQANQRWSLAAQSDGLGLFEWRSAGDRVLLDARACAIYGLAGEPQGLDLPRSQLRALVDPEDVQALQQALDQALASDQPFFRHCFRIALAGSESPRHLEVTGLMRNGDGAARDERRMVGVIKDVSARLRQTKLELDKAAAERSAAARMEFLSRLSHELRTPLNAVLGFSELLRLDPAERLSQGQARRIELIEAAGRHLLHLVDDVLDITSIDSGRFHLERRPTPLAPALAAAVALVSAEQQAQEVELELPPLPASLRVLADDQRLVQVLANLLSNACKYNRRGGRVRVSLRPRENGRLDIAIEDQGPGLDEAEQAQLFQPFKRLPATAHLPGTGLGLSIVKLLVEQMGGRVTVSSRPGEGAVFTLELELA